MRFGNFEFDGSTDRLGEGPQSEVFKAVDTRLGRTVALKILRPHIEFDPQARERFEREAKHTSHLAHPNIATVYEYGQDEGTSFIAMEFLQGRTLDKLLEGGPLGYEEGLRLALQVTSALGLVHGRGLVHRDLKPANIMVLEDGTVKLLDFGICRSTGESKITQEGMLVGTVLYMSPEQVLGDDIDVRADVFALGSVLFHTFTGKLPFPGRSFPEVCMSILEAQPKSPEEARLGFPADLGALIMKCLAREPEERFPAGGMVHGALLQVAEGMRIGVAPALPASITGSILIPPMELGDGGEHAKLFASGLCRDLEEELERSTDLEITVLQPGEPTSLHETSFIMRGTLDFLGAKASLDIVLERRGSGATAEASKIAEAHIEHEDSDEWGLQAKMVNDLARALRRQIQNYAAAPQPAERRDPAKAIHLSKVAHEILQCGTARHTLAALSGFRRALDEDPGCAMAHAGMAEGLVHKFLYWQGDRSFLREARAEARRALSLDSQCAEAHTSLGFAASMAGSPQDAHREYRMAIQIDHEEWLAHRLLGALLGRQGNLKGAAPLLRRAIGLKPTHIGSYDHLYCVLRRIDRYEEAIEMAERGIEAARKHLDQVPRNQEARLHLGMILARLGLNEDALVQLNEARRIAPKDAYTLFHASCLYALLDQPENAIATLCESQARGYYLQSELLRNSDLDSLRGLDAFQELTG